MLNTIYLKSCALQIIMQLHAAGPCRGFWFGGGAPLHKKKFGGAKGGQAKVEKKNIFRGEKLKFLKKISGAKN